MTEILVPISPGELIDKLTILRLKAERIEDEVKLNNVTIELEMLSRVSDASLPTDDRVDALTEDLYQTNSELWEIEDDIRRCEERGDFGEGFIGLARAVYKTNDRRARLKKEINSLLGSKIVEEKSYAGPAGAPDP